MMGQQMAFTIQCSKCKRAFQADPQVQYGEGKIETTWFECSHCKSRVIGYRTDPAARKLQKQVGTERRRGLDPTAFGAARRLRRYQRRLQKQLYLLNPTVEGEGEGAGA